MYDYDERRIGPFRCPIEVLVDKNAGALNTIPLSNFYKLLQNNKEAVAVWNVNNTNIAMLTNTRLYLRAADGSSYIGGDELPIWQLPKPLVIPIGEHIGWVRTIDRTKVVYHYPWYLYYNKEFRRFLDARFTNDEVKGTPRPNPPMSLYKDLLSTSYNAVYIDDETGAPVFLKGEF